MAAHTYALMRIYVHTTRTRRNIQRGGGGRRSLAREIHGANVVVVVVVEALYAHTYTLAAARVLIGWEVWSS